MLDSNGKPIRKHISDVSSISTRRPKRSRRSKSPHEEKEVDWLEFATDSEIYAYHKMQQRKAQKTKKAASIDSDSVLSNRSDRSLRVKPAVFRPKLDKVKWDGMSSKF